MGSPAKPFACTAPECGQRFTNEDHLTVHSRKHDLELQLALGHKTAAFPADQTPTPTRFIRNCEEVGLFQDLQNVNPFDEGFKRAMETNKNEILISLDNAIAAATSDDTLHTPNLFPNLSLVTLDVTDSNLFDTNTKNITRSSSDESTTVHYESTIETKLTNEVTITDQNEPNQNVITIQSNIEIRKADYSTIVASNDPNLIKLMVKNNEKDVGVVKKDVLLTDAGKMPVISQKSLDYAIDSLTSHIDTPKPMKNQELIDTMKKNMTHVLKKTEMKEEEKKRGKKRRSEDVKVPKPNYEVMLKLPNGELVHMKTGDVEKTDPKTVAKQKLKDVIESKLKTEIEKEIRNDIENKIQQELQSGQYVIKVLDPESINSKVIQTVASPHQEIVLKIASKDALAPNASCHNPNLVPVIVNSPNILIPVKKIPLPPFKIPEPSKNSSKTYEVYKRRKKNLVALDKIQIQHKHNCDILTKVGMPCNMNCSATDNKLNSEVNLKTSAVENKSKTDIIIDESQQNKIDENTEKLDHNIVQTREIEIFSHKKTNNSPELRLENIKQTNKTHRPQDNATNTKETSEQIDLLDIAFNEDIEEERHELSKNTVNNNEEEHLLQHVNKMIEGPQTITNILFITTGAATDEIELRKVDLNSNQNNIDITTANIVGSEKVMQNVDSNCDSETHQHENHKQGNNAANVMVSVEAYKRESNQEAVRRYRRRQKEKLGLIIEKNKQHEQERDKLKKRLCVAERQLAVMKQIFIEHCSVCQVSETLKERLNELMAKEDIS